MAKMGLTAIRGTKVTVAKVEDVIKESYNSKKKRALIDLSGIRPAVTFEGHWIGADVKIAQKTLVRAYKARKQILIKKEIR
jgi:hypothetical protein